MSGIYASISPSDVLYGQNFGITANGTTDDTAAFNAFMAACKAAGRKGELPRGTIRLASKPNDIDFAWDIGGKGYTTTVIIRDYNGSGHTGCLALVPGANGTRIHDLSIQSSSGKTAGSMISGVSSSSDAISGITLENLWLTTQGSDTQTSTICLDGTARTSGAIGIRDIYLTNVHCFGSNGYSARLLSCVGLVWNGGGVYAAGGTAASSGGLEIGGVGSVKTSNLSIEFTGCNGMNLTNCYDCQIISPITGAISGYSVNNANTCSYTCVYGHMSGTVAGNWLYSGVRRPSAAWAAT